jgi:hypothetical protein
MNRSRRDALKSTAAALAAIAASTIAGPKPGAPGGCKVVEGPISPRGWCIAFVKKP